MFLFILNKIELKNILMNENLYNMFDDILVSDFNIRDEGIKKVVELGKMPNTAKWKPIQYLNWSAITTFVLFFHLILYETILKTVP